MCDETKWNEAVTWDELVYPTVGNCGNSLLFYFFINSGKQNFTFKKLKKKYSEEYNYLVFLNFKSEKNGDDNTSKE